MSYARLEALDGIQWPCYDETIPASSSCTRACGKIRSTDRARRLRRSSTIRRSKRSTTSIRCGSRPGGGSTRSTPACRAAATPRRCGAARGSTSRREDARALRRCRRRARPGQLAARLGRRSRAHRSRLARRPGLHDAAFQRRGRDEFAHDRCDGSEIRNRRVQGRGRAHRTRLAQMDLHFTSAAPTAAEREAVDALARATCATIRRRRARASRRHLLLPALHAVARTRRLDQRRRAQLRLPAPLRAACRAFGVASFYEMFSTEPRRRWSCCTSATTSRAWAPAPTRSATRSNGVRPAGTPRTTDGRRGCAARVSGLCERAPAALLIAAGEQPTSPQSRRRPRESSAACDRRDPATCDLAPAARRRHGASPAAARRHGRSREPRRVSRAPADTRRCARALRTRPDRRRSRRSSHRNSWAAAARRFPPGARCRPSRSAGDGRTISSATPTNRSRGRSKTAC